MIDDSSLVGMMNVADRRDLRVNPLIKDRHLGDSGATITRGYLTQFQAQTAYPEKVPR